jgi:hypothetical protein
LKDSYLKVNVHLRTAYECIVIVAAVGVAVVWNAGENIATAN